MTKQQHTPLYINQYVDLKTPYVSICRKNSAYAFGTNPGEELICNVPDVETANMIVRACNAHYEMLEALKSLTVEYIKDRTLVGEHPEENNLIVAARAAIEKASGQ